LSSISGDYRDHSAKNQHNFFVFINLCQTWIHPGSSRSVFFFCTPFTGPRRQPEGKEKKEENNDAPPKEKKL
jgi:hypothetical protein